MSANASSGRGALITTTVRFDADLWARVRTDSARLGIGRSTLIRDAVRAYVAAADERTRCGCVTAEVVALGHRVDRLEGWARAVVRGSAARARARRRS